MYVTRCKFAGPAFIFHRNLRTHTRNDVVSVLEKWLSVDFLCLEIDGGGLRRKTLKLLEIHEIN